MEGSRVTDSRFTAPVAGTYLFVQGQEPRLLTPEEAAAPVPPGAQTIRFEAGDGIMNSGVSLSPTDGTFSMPWWRP